MNLEYKHDREIINTDYLGSKMNHNIRIELKKSGGCWNMSKAVRNMSAWDM